MKVKALIQEIIEEFEDIGYPGKVPDRRRILRHMSFDLTELTGREDWDWAMVHLDPVILCQVGKRAYRLPADFPDNFVRFAGDKGDKWCCQIDDGNNEVLLDYVSPTQFYSLDRTAESNAKPVKYTIMSLPNGTRQILFSPPPDDDYTVDGLYVPTDWGLDEEDDLPPVPGNSAILKYLVMRRYLSDRYEPLYREALGILTMRAARQRATRIVSVETDDRSEQLYDVR